MTISAIRRANLQRLVAAEPNGNQSAFAAKVGRSASAINQYLHSKNMGGRFARDLESALKLSPGWMDREHGTPAPVLWGLRLSREAAELAAEWEKIRSPEVRAAARTMIYAAVTNEARESRKSRPAASREKIVHG